MLIHREQTFSMAYPSYTWTRPCMATTCLPPNKPNTRRPTCPDTVGTQMYGRSKHLWYKQVKHFVSRLELSLCKLRKLLTCANGKARNVFVFEGHGLLQGGCQAAEARTTHDADCWPVLGLGLQESGNLRHFFVRAAERIKQIYYRCPSTSSWEVLFPIVRRRVRTRHKQIWGKVVRRRMIILQLSKMTPRLLRLWGPCTR